MPYKLSSRLLATTAFALVGTVFVLVVLVLQFFRMEPGLLITRELESSAAMVAEGLKLGPGGAIEVEVPELMSAMFQHMRNDGAYRILDESGRVLASSDGASAAFTPNGRTFPDVGATFEIEAAGVGQHVLTTQLSRAGRTLFVQVMRSDRIHQATLSARRGSSTYMLITIITLPMAVFSVVVLSTLHRVLLKPLRNLTSAAAEIGPHNLGARLSPARLPAELTPLVESFNATLDRLEHGFVVQREFLAAAAHELKTPIALMRGEIELDGVNNRAVLLQDLDQMARQVHQLLHLAEVSERQNYKFSLIEVAPIVDEVVGQIDRLAQQLEVDLVWRGSFNRVSVSGDGGGIFVLLRNLIENAIHHAPPGTRVEIELRNQGFSVRDYGPGIDEAVMPLIFKRFWRGPHRRDTGAGLGLAICHEVATVHGWEIRVENLHPGTRLSILFGRVLAA